MKLRPLATLVLFATSVSSAFAAQTVVSIDGEKFFINGRLTYEGRTWKNPSRIRYP